jgi:hypothetical protein
MSVLNFGTPAFDAEQKLPKKFEIWVKRDEKYIKSLLESGHPPMMDWARAKRELQDRLSELVGRRVQCFWINIDEHREYHRIWNDISYDGVYELLCVRTDYMVLLCCPSSKLSAELYRIARAECKLFPFVTDVIRKMIKEIHTKQQPTNWPNYIANFGLGTRNQSPAYSSTAIVQARNAASNMVRFTHRMVNHVTEAIHD